MSKLLNNDESLDSLPFDKNKQAAFFGHLFNEANGLFKQFRYSADASWFANPAVANAWKGLQSYLEIVRKMPTAVELSNWTYLQVTLSSKEAAKATSQAIMVCAEHARTVSAEHLRNELELWMQARLFQSAMAQTTDLFNKSKFPQAAQIFRDTIKKFGEIQVSRHEDKRFDATEDIVEAYQSQSYIKFGLAGVDQHLNPDSAEGGLALGDQTLILAPQNVGKSTTCETILLHNVLDGKYGLFQSHEGRDTDIRMKGLRCALTMATLPQLANIFGIAPDNVNLLHLQTVFREHASTLRGMLDLMTKPKSDDLRNYYQHMATWISERLYYRPVNKAGMTIEDVIPVIERAQEDCIHARGGKGFDLLVSDQPQLLGSKKAGKEYAYRQVLDIVYREYVQMALQNKWHSLCAIQGNREAGKINSGQSRNRNGQDKRFLTTEDIAEAYGPGQSASNVITLNRSPLDEAQGRITFYIAKSRSSRTKLAVTAYDRMAQGVSHANEFGWLSYYHTAESPMILQRFMQRGNGRGLNQEQVVTALRDSDEAG